MHIIRANIGMGVLSIPWAMNRVGLVVGPVLLLVMILLSTLSMINLVKTARFYSR